MTETVQRWAAASASVRGSSHERSGTPNQDAVRIVEVDGPVAGLVAAVCDGHGSARYVRSDVGARLGVEVACEVGRRALRELGATPDRDTIEAALAGPVATSIVGRWRERVSHDVVDRPFTTDERTRAGAPLEDDPHVSYGCTLVLAVLGPSWVGLLQIGDGDLTVVSDRRAESPVPGDDRLVGGETTSLCLKTAVADARVSALVGSLPELVILTSDGYANSFASPNWRTEVGSDLRDHIWRVGLDEVGSRLPEWLSDSAIAGGDDVTMALVLRVDALGAGAGALVEPPTMQPGRSSTGEGVRASGRRRALVGSALVLAAVAGGAGGWALARADRSANPPATTGGSVVVPTGTDRVETAPDTTAGRDPEAATTTEVLPTITEAPTTSEAPPSTTVAPTVPTTSAPATVVPPLLTDEQSVHLAVGWGHAGILAFDDDDPGQSVAWSFGWVRFDGGLPSLPVGWTYGFGELVGPDGSGHRAEAVLASERYVWAVSDDRRTLMAYDPSSGQQQGSVVIVDVAAGSQQQTEPDLASQENEG